MPVLSFIKAIGGLIAYQREWATTSLTNFTCGVVAIATTFSFLIDFALVGVAENSRHGNMVDARHMYSFSDRLVLLLLCPSICDLPSGTKLGQFRLCAHFDTEGKTQTHEVYAANYNRFLCLPYSPFRNSPCS